MAIGAVNDDIGAEGEARRGNMSTWVRMIAAIFVSASALSTGALAGTFQTLYSFKGGITDLSGPVVPPVVHDGLLYGLAAGGGSTACHKGGCGGFYSLDPKTGIETVLDDFEQSSRFGNVHNQSFNLLFDRGRFYSATDNGGSHRQGDIISLTLKGRTHVAYSFSEPDNGADDSVGASLALSGGVLYGSVSFEFSSTLPPSLFKFDPVTDSLVTLYTFPATTPDTHALSAPVLVGTTLYGTDFFGGINGKGRLFSYDMTTGVETDLHSFTGGRDGEYPGEIVVFRGKIFGVTTYSDSGSYGCIYRYDIATGRFVVIHENEASDAALVFSLVVGGNTLYGSAALTNENGGAILSVDPTNGNEDVLQTIPGTNGSITTLTFSKDTLYGATLSGGSFGLGSIFAFTP